MPPWLMPIMIIWGLEQVQELMFLNFMCIALKKQIIRLLLNMHQQTMQFSLLRYLWRNMAMFWMELNVYRFVRQLLVHWSVWVQLLGQYLVYIVKNLNIKFLILKMVVANVLQDIIQQVQVLVRLVIQALAYVELVLLSLSVLHVLVMLKKLWIQAEIWLIVNVRRDFSQAEESALPVHLVVLNAVPSQPAQFAKIVSIQIK